MRMASLADETESFHAGPRLSERIRSWLAPAAVSQEIDNPAEYFALWFELHYQRRRKP